MLPRTFTTSVKLFCCNVALVYMGYFSLVLGLMPVYKHPKKQRMQTNIPFTLYCIILGCLVTWAYKWNLDTMASGGPKTAEEDEEQPHYFGSFKKVTWILIYACSTGLIAGFYVLSILNRNRFCAFLNKTADLALTYSGFYKGSVTRGYLTRNHVDSEEELDKVFYPFFVKMIVVHGLVVAVSVAKALRGNALTGGSIMRTLVSSGVPFLLISLTTSYLFLQGARINFIYHRMNDKLKEVHGELLTMGKSKRSHFVRMSKCCEMSDLVDELAECYCSIHDTAHNLFDIYKFQICLIIVYTIVSALHVLFSQFQVVIEFVRDGIPMDSWVFSYNIAFVVLVILDLLLAIRINDACHQSCAKIAKTNQSLLYFADLDIRLRKSVEMFSLLMQQNPLEISLMGMHLLDFPLTLGIFDATCTYLAIIIQFYN